MTETEHEMEGLRPCIFCGTRSAVLVVDQIDGVPKADDVCFVRCLHCFAQGPSRSTEERAIREWNIASGWAVFAWRTGANIPAREELSQKRI